MSRQRQDSEDEQRTTNPVGTMLGATWGPFGAAIGSMFDANRFAFTFQFGTGALDAADDDDGLDDAATIEIEDAADADATDAEESESEADAENERRDAE